MAGSESIRAMVADNQKVIDELNAKLQKKTTEIKIIQALSGEMNATLNLERVFDLILTATNDVLGFRHSMILLKDAHADVLNVVATRGYDSSGVGAEVPFGQGVIGIVAQKRRMMRMVGMAYRGRYIQAAAEATGSQTQRVTLPGLPNVQSQIAIPLIVKNELIGVFAVESDELSAFDSLDEILISIIANQMGGAIANARLYASLEDKVAQLESANQESQRLRGQLLEKEKMATVGSMAAGIVHDLKNPVAVIKGYAEMADGDVGREKRRQYLGVIDQEAQRMVDMVQDLLDYSQGSVSIDKQDVCLAEYLQRAEATLAPTFLQKGIGISTECDGQIRAALDPDRFLRAIVNIAGNAADAMSPGGHFAMNVFGRGKRVIFELSDKGPGIPEAIRDTLFEPFVTHGKSHGTGLGMAITKSMVEAHGGTISFTTQTGKGTTFRIELPA